MTKHDLDRLIDNHWGYVEGILKVAQLPEHTINNIGFHYKSAFEHGWKHAKEDSSIPIYEETNLDEFTPDYYLSIDENFTD